MALVLNLILIAFGTVAYTRLTVREYPDIDPPIVTVETYYRGASAGVVERRITQRLEDRISQVEAIKNISSVSVDGKSEITVEFNLGRSLGRWRAPAGIAAAAAKCCEFPRVFRVFCVGTPLAKEAAWLAT